MSINEKHDYFMLRCLDLAHQAQQNGDHPFGAVLTLRGKTVCESLNEVNTNKDVTEHAEMRLVKQAQKILGPSDLKDCVLYTSTEPCAMCAGAIYWSGIREVVYGCSTKELVEIVKGGLSIGLDQVFKSSGDQFNLIQFKGNQDFSQIHRNFWS